jgi:hypothetical protein
MAIRTEKKVFEFISKTKAIIVFVGIIVILSGSFIIHLYETQDSFKVENIPYTQIDTIEISDRGLLGNSSIIITNKDSILIMNKILIDSKIVSFDNINVKSNKGESDITIHIKNSEPIKLYLINTSFSGGILSSGDYYYQNTPLLNFVMNKLM